MTHTILRNAALIGGLIACGLACAAAAPFMVSPSGAIGPTVFQSQSPGSAALAVVVCMGIAAIIGCVVARVINTVVGLFVIGAGVFVLAGRLATISAIAFSAGGTGRSPLMMLALESMFWSVLMLGVAIVVFRFGGALTDVYPPTDIDSAPHPLFSRDAVRSAAAAAIVLPAVWFIAQSSMNGQVIAAVFLGSMAAGLIGRLLSPHVQPVLLFAAPIFFGALGHLIGMVWLRSPLDATFVLGRLSPLSLPMPIDYAAGSLMGISVGLGWAKSFLQHEEPDELEVVTPVATP